jgi:hypothetical protein
MSGGVTKQPFEDLMQLTAARLRDELSPALEEIRRYGVEKLLVEYPDLLARLLDKLKQADAAELLSRTPGLTHQLTALLWQGIVFRAGQSKEMISVLENLERDFHCNMEASDSPFRSHFTVEKGKIHGASGLLHFKDEDFRFMGPTEVLIELLTGDLSLGFGNLRLQTAGHPGWLKRIAPVMRKISELIKGG